MLFTGVFFPEPLKDFECKGPSLTFYFGEDGSVFDKCFSFSFIETYSYVLGLISTPFLFLLDYYNFSSLFVVFGFLLIYCTD